ncbi:uncharacterized protein B0H18DRAFT_835010, partial [Fomitopsis serialis]|uniref:uncharacterized protein n=1 Tax=Fomitopsis serialis TaxID=139415 RepID=UPI002007E43F
ATSTAVEHVFSQGCHLLHFTRNHMTGATFRANLCLGAWGQANILYIQDLVEVV